MTSLHRQLAADTQALAENDFCWLRYIDDQRFPWVVIVPKQNNLREWFELDKDNQIQLLTLTNRIACALQHITAADKINLGALGNLVPQLHIHVIARYKNDPCWPGPVWGCGQSEPSGEMQPPAWATALLSDLQTLL